MNLNLNLKGRFKGWNHSPLFVLLITLFFSGALSYFIFLDTQAELLARLERTERRIQHSVQTRIAVYINTLISVRSYLASEKKFSRAGFARFIEGLSIQTKYPGLIALDFITKVDKKDLASHLQQVRREGFSKYKIWPPSSEQQMMPIYFLEPFNETNQKAFGFDMMTDPVRREALEIARDTGDPTATKKIEFVQETQTAETPVNRRYGFDIFIPLYKSGWPVKTVAQRRAAITGFVVSPFHMDELFDEILYEENFQQDLITFQLYDGPAVDDTNLIYSPQFIKSDVKTHLQRAVPISFATRRLTLNLKTLPAFSSSSSVNSHWIVLGLGFFACFLLYFFLRSAFRHAEKTEKNEHQLRLITNALPVLISYTDRFSAFKFINKAYVDWFGQKEDWYLGRTLADVFGTANSSMNEMIRKKALAGETVIFEMEMTHQTKGRRKLLAQYLPDFQKNGSVAGIIGLATDITDEWATQTRIREQARTVEIINQVVLSLQAETDLEKILQYVVDAATEISKAQFGVFYYPITTFEENTSPPFKVSGLTESQKSEIFSRKNIHQFELTAQSTGIVRSQDILLEINFGFNPFLTEEGINLNIRSYFSVPVMARSGQLEGTLYLGHSETGIFTEQTERVVSGLAAQAAVAIDSAELYQALFKSEKHAHTLAHQQAFLAEAGQILNSTLNFDSILKKIPEIVIPEIADWCQIHMINSQGQIDQCIVGNQNARQIQYGEELNKSYPITLEATTGPGKIIRSGKAELISEITFSPENCSGGENSYFKIMQALGFKSYVGVPLRTRDRIVGCLGLAISESEKRYSPTDLELLEDLASRVSLAIENAQLYAEAQTVNRIKDEFLATLSHELRTPLNVILGHAEILKAEAPQLGSDLDLSIDAIYRNASIQNQIIGDLLDISGIITGQISFHPHLISPNEIMATAVKSIQFTAVAKQIDLQLKTDGHDLKIAGDAIRFQQIIWNLLSNAMKFTPKGGTVTISCFRESFSRVIIEVRDTGEGIDPNFIPYVFDRFRQEDSSLTRKFGGLGLGLSIVRQLVELHGGTIQVQSAGKNKGSLFRVSLPEANEKGFLMPAEKSMTSPIPNSSSVSLSQIKILVLDDEPDARELMAQLLSRAGAQVQMASTVVEAFEKFKSFRPQIIISDLGLPFEDGYSFIKRVRTYEKENHLFTPAAALTAYAREEDKIKALNAGFQIHIAKPIGGKELVQVIAELVLKYIRPRPAELAP